MTKADELKIVNEFLRLNTFVDESNRCGFIIAHWNGMTKNLLPSDILNANISDKRMSKRLHIDHEKQVIMLKVNIRFIKSMNKIGDNGPRLYLCLRQFFTEDAIKNIFPMVDRMFRSMEERKARATAMCKANHERNTIGREIYFHTRGMSLKTASKSYGVL